MNSIRPVHIDGALYAAIILVGAMQFTFGTDEAAKHIGPTSLFWLKVATGWGVITLGGIKMFRSDAVSKDRKEQQTGLTESGTPVEVANK